MSMSIPLHLEETFCLYEGEQGEEFKFWCFVETYKLEAIASKIFKSNKYCT